MASEHWRWEPSIGLRYGIFKGKPAVQVHQPLMTSPWWTLSADDTREDFVRIYPTVGQAIDAAEQEYEGRPKTLSLTGTVCHDRHAARGSEGVVYGHHGSNRICTRVGETDTWVYDLTSL